MEHNTIRPIDPLPHSRQLARQNMPLTMFVHFNMNTFTGVEWGHGRTPAEKFNPSGEDFCRQWARVARENKFAGIVLTCKHHDGFCIWPSRFTDYTIAGSPYRKGEGDIVKELSEACREEGIKFGVYLSPWDRNHNAYGTEEYNDIFIGTLTELLTSYGDIYEVWFDGAPGENSKDAVQRYDWERYIETVRTYQPEAVIFSDAGPDIRWVGNERGYAERTNWAFLRRDEFRPGVEGPGLKDLPHGQEDGTHWVPSEIDTSIRPGWYYHRREDLLVKSVKRLMDNYYCSVGRNGTYLLNIPPDKTGFFHKNDVKRLGEFSQAIAEDFRTDIVQEALQKESVRTDGESTAPHHGENILKADESLYWAGTEKDGSSLTVSFDQTVRFNRLELREPVYMGQRVRRFTVEALSGGSWKTIARETTIGACRIIRMPETRTGKLRITIQSSRALPLLSRLSLYLAPERFAGKSRLRKSVDSFLAAGTRLKNRRGRRILQCPGDDIRGARSLLDGSNETVWSGGRTGLPAALVIDAGRMENLTGLLMTPAAVGKENLIFRFRLEISRDCKNWSTVLERGEFGNVVNNPDVDQTVLFQPLQGRYIRFTALETADNSPVCHFSLKRLDYIRQD